VTPRRKSYAEDVRRQHVGGALHALERSIDGASQRLRESSLTDARDVFDQQMTARQQARRGQLDRFGLAANEPGHRRFERRRTGFPSPFAHR
jgi:hypothetical protein